MYVEAVTPSTSEPDYIWREFLKRKLRFKEVTGMGPNTAWLMFSQDDEIRTQTQREDPGKAQREASYQQTKDTLTSDVQFQKWEEIVSIV